MMASLLQVESRDELGISVLTPAKINLWLEVLGKRDDGFHEIVSLMQPVGWYDHLSFQFSKTRDDLKVQGGAAPEDSSNLVMKALHQARRSRDIDPVHIVLKKSIPAEAGLGGGSSNAAATLACLHEWTPDPRGWAGVLMDARLLGSDIPFFLGQGPAVVRGRGELIEPISQPLFGNTEMYACIWKPDFGLGTADVYSGLTGPLTYATNCRNFNQLIFKDSESWKHQLHNRLLEAAKIVDPRIRIIADLLEVHFAGRWLMTGSGSGFVILSAQRKFAQEDSDLLGQTLKLLGQTLKESVSEDRRESSNIHSGEIKVVPLLTS